jgi:predicted RNA binding protein YcfA (HicA-like mRNA interferase family)
MKLPRNLDANDLIKALSRIGYAVVRQTGSHIRLHCGDDVEIAHRLERDTLVSLLFD